ncbi:MAG: folate/biopterin family MFS transporter [Symploca sp. SIO2B6]|nr:folate/biopterin family MFS transporter [Symploca sp. SIO2B6]
MVTIASRVTQIRDSFLKSVLFGNKPSPELAAILLVYFVQGILGLASLAVSFFLKDDLGLSPTEVAALTGVGLFPWMIKPLFGLLSDNVPILGYRRRPYLILAGVAGSLVWVAMATIVTTPWAVTVAIVCNALAIALSDVIVDSLVVERARRESQAAAGSLQSLCWGTSAFGSLITAYFSGFLLERVTVQTVFLITASFPLIVSMVAWLIDETPVRHAEIPTADEAVEIATHPPQESQLKRLWQAVKQRSVWMPTVFIFLWQATPSSGSAFFFFTTNDLGFQPEFLGRVQLVTSIAAIVGIWLFQTFFKSVPFRQIIGWSIVIATLLGMTSLLLVTHTNRALGISDQWFSIGDTLILTVMGEIAFMPLLVLAARICPEGVEATLFALLMSVFNCARLVSQEGGALLTHVMGVTETDFTNLWLLVLVTNLSSLLPLPFLGLLPNQTSNQVSNQTLNQLPSQMSNQSPNQVPHQVSNQENQVDVLDMPMSP